MEFSLSFVYVIVYCVGVKMSTLMSISEGLDPYNFCRKMEHMRSTKEEMDRKVFISHQCQHFSFVNIMIKVLFPICTLNWLVNSYVSRHEEGKTSRNKSIFINIKLQPSVLLKEFFFVINCLYRLKPFPSERGVCISLKVHLLKK